MALGDLTRDASCEGFSSFQELTDTEVAQSSNGWKQPLRTPTYFDTRQQAPPIVLPSEKSNDGDWFESQSNMGSSLSQESLRSLMRPKFAFSSEWLTSSDFDLSAYDLRVTVPTYPFFGPPPPMISVGFAYTDLIDADAVGLPDDLYEYSIGLSWIRPIRDRWMVRSMLGVALATYGDWRVVAGWESVPTPIEGARFTPGRKHGLEIDYVFSRDLEFSSGSPDVSLTDAVTLGITTRF